MTSIVLKYLTIPLESLDILHRAWNKSKILLETLVYRLFRIVDSKRGKLGGGQLGGGGAVHMYQRQVQYKESPSNLSYQITNLLISRPEKLSAHFKATYQDIWNHHRPGPNYCTVYIYMLHCTLQYMYMLHYTVQYMLLSTCISHVLYSIAATTARSFTLCTTCEYRELILRTFLQNLSQYPVFCVISFHWCI